MRKTGQAVWDLKPLKDISNLLMVRVMDFDFLFCLFVVARQLIEMP